MARKNKITCTEPSQPSFIRAFKEKAGYKDGPTLSDKFKPVSKEDNAEEEVDPKSELLELIKNEQLSVSTTLSSDYTKEDLKDVLEGKSPSALIPETKVEKKEELSKLPYDEKRDGKILYRPSSKVKRPSEDSQQPADNRTEGNKKKKERDSSRRMLTCIPSDEDSDDN